MKIAQVVHLFPPATGGIEHHTYEICRKLAENDNEVAVFTTDVGKAPKEKSGFLIKRFFSLNLPIFSSVRFPPMLFFSLMQSNFDVYCSHGYGSLMPFITAIACWLKRKPFVFTLHGYPKLKGIGGLFQKLYSIFIASIYLRIAQKVIVVSQASVADIMKEVDESKIVHVANGINPEEFSCGDFSEKNAITYVGRLDKYKGIDVLIRAFAKLKEKNSEIQLVIAGRDEGIRKELSELAAKQNVEIDFQDVPYSEIKKVYCNSKAIVLPSRYEGFSLVWLEAIASSRPMFSTPVGDAKKVFSDLYGNEAGQFLFNGEDELVGKLGSMLKDPKGYSAIIRRAEERCKKKYSWEKIAKDTLEVYKKLLS
jgi:glycosyltransferase involved in cell wall biosynthesis